MIFDSLGLGELGVVAVLGILLVNPKRLGSMLRQFHQFKRKVSQLQNQVRQQINTLVLEDEIRESKTEPAVGKAALRRWAKDQVAAIPAFEKQSKSQVITQAILAWPVFQEAPSLCAFMGMHDEVDTEALIQAALSAGKAVYLPYVYKPAQPADNLASTGASERTSETSLKFCRIYDLNRDLTESDFGILEPKTELRNSEQGGEKATLEARRAALTLTPGLCFDALGGRVGHGKGYYDKHLALAKTYAVGVAFEAQVHAKKLPLETHDMNLDALVTEGRFLLYSDPPGPVKQEPQNEAPSTQIEGPENPDRGMRLKA